MCLGGRWEGGLLPAASADLSIFPGLSFNRVSPVMKQGTASSSTCISQAHALSIPWCCVPQSHLDVDTNVEFIKRQAKAYENLFILPLSHVN